METLKHFLTSLRHLSFFNRLFGWKRVKNELMDAVAALSVASAQLSDIEKRVAHLQNAQQLNEEKNTQLVLRRSELEKEIFSLRKDLQVRQDQLTAVQLEKNSLIKEEEQRKLEHSTAVASLNKIQQQLQEGRNREIEEINNEKLERLTLLKNTWSDHETQTRSIIKALCLQHNIGYVDKVPFKGSPDNTLFICDEYVVFDAKSPAGDDLKHFPLYLKDQAEKASKYANQENVKSDIFFVIPANTLMQLSQFVYRHGDHNVYLISAEALEPVILSLQKIEEYEFAKELSPDDRENICRVLGRFAHLSKRRIQVDNFFARQFMELAYKCEASLPPEILSSMLEFERAEKLNPPQEKRAKAIAISEIERENLRLTQEAEGRGIIMDSEEVSSGINELPLYKNNGCL